MRGVDCVCATEPPCSSDIKVGPPCSSDNKVGDAGAAAIARALEKNTTLQALVLSRELVVLCCVCGGGLIVVYVVVGCCWAAVGVEGRVRGVDCVCATEPPWSSGCGVTDAGAVSLAQALQKNTTLHTLNLHREFVVMCLVRGVDCGLCCCGMLLICVWGLGACALC